MTRCRALQITGEGACTFQSMKTFRAHMAQKSLQNDVKECQDDGLVSEHVDNTIYFDDVFRAFRSNLRFNHEDKVELVIPDIERVL
jgi:hypothetical protein